VHALNIGWIIQPLVRKTNTIAVISIFTAMVVGSDLALSGVSNVKLLDTLVFVSAYVFGFRVGASVGILSETIWSFVSPVGIAGAMTPFLVGGEILFAVAGWAASRLWGTEFRIASPYPVFIGALLAICAFAWDAETNAATALLGNTNLLVTMFGPLTLWFTTAHEVSDFVFGSLVAPASIVLIPKVLKGRV
jgi:hypothetical protein